MVQVISYGDVYRDYVRHPELKSAGPDGWSCGPQTVGLLHRRKIEVAHIYHVGKESNRLEDVQQGLVAGIDEVVE